MVDRFTLSGQDKNLIQQVLTWWKGFVLPPDPGLYEQNYQTPDIYIALPQSALGIPAITLVGSTPAVGDTPGSGTCDIYRIDSSGDIEAYTGFDKTVFNVSFSVIPKQWFIVARSKQGKWVSTKQPDGIYVALPPSGGIPGMTEISGTN